jgi:hypothetical protein
VSSRRRKALACGLHVLCESTSAQSACPCSQQTAPPPCAQVRCITLIYVENVGSQFHSLRHRPDRSRFSGALAGPISGSGRRCFGKDLCTAPSALQTIWFSNGRFFSQALYHCGSVQSSASQYFQASVGSHVRSSLAAPTAIEKSLLRFKSDGSTLPAKGGIVLDLRKIPTASVEVIIRATGSEGCRLRLVAGK